MAQVKLRKVGGSMMLAIPPSILEDLPFGPDAALSLSVSKGKLMVSQAKPQYRLDDLLSEHVAEPINDGGWLVMPVAGREI